MYYAGFKFQVRGYEKVAINYEDFINKGDSLVEHIEEVKNAILLKLQAIDLARYDDIVFVSKSIGTVIAGWIEEKLCIEVRQIYLTPVKETLPYIKRNSITLLGK